MPKILELVEYQAISLPKEDISGDVEELLVTRFKNQIGLEPPWAKTKFMWRVISLGWIGYIPINETFGISLKPKVPLVNLFKMLTYAYQLKSIQFLDGEFSADSIQDFYDYLAKKLSLMILRRTQKGLYREYYSEEDTFPYICGRINLNGIINKPWNINFAVNYENYSADIIHNQILLYTLDIISRSGLCSSKVQTYVHKAYRSILGYSSTKKVSVQECLDVLYNRLNVDYKPMHLLCRFFIEHIGPKVYVGERAMIPFVIDMAQLFELFVAEWMQVHLPDNYELTQQFRYSVDAEERVFFEFDLAIKEKNSEGYKYILDTKYKHNQEPDPKDIAQVVAYAQSVGCKETVLVYPIYLINPYQAYSGDIRIRSLAFDLSDDIEGMGEKFLSQLFN